LVVWWQVGPEKPIGQWHKNPLPLLLLLLLLPVPVPLLLVLAVLTQVPPFPHGELAQAGCVDVSHLTPFHWLGHAQLETDPVFCGNNTQNVYH
jgi:hypothetical protein